MEAVYKIVDNKVIDKNGYCFDIPAKPDLGDMNLRSQLLESKYFIN